MSGERPETRGPRRTWLLTAALAVGAGLLLARGYQEALYTTSLPRIVILCGLAVVFLLGEQLLMNVEFRKQAHSFTLAGVPLVLGALVAPMPDLVLARVLGAGVALVIQRISFNKLSYNLMAYAFEAALLGTLAHLLMAPHDLLTLRTAAVMLAITVACDQLMSALVLLVIRWHGGSMEAKEVALVLGRAAILAVAVTGISFCTLLLARAGEVGVAVAVVIALVAFVVYRSYLIATKRHQRFELLHEFVSGSADSRSLTELARQLLPRIRSLLRAAHAEILIVQAEQIAAAPFDDAADHQPAQEAPGTTSAGKAPTRYRPTGNVTRITDRDEGFRVVTEDAVLDWAATRAIDHAEPMLAPRSTKDRAVRGWLEEHAYRDGMIVSIPQSSGLVATLTVAGRLGETSTFTDDDLTLLQTLAGHFAVAVGHARLLEQLTFDATHDTLTGLANRAVLSRALDSPVTADTAGCCVLMLDVDRFKEINDGFGHATGDELLRQIAQRLRKVLRAEATLARLGGDEFAAIVPDVAGDQRTAHELGQRLADALTSPVTIDDALITPEASIGIAVACTGEPRSDLLRQADIAMYEAKASGSRIAVYHHDMDRGRLENLALLADLRSALRDHQEQIAVYYQPKVDMATRQVVSAEALVRWNHPTLGVLGPDRFIPLAEKTGLVDQFTPLVLRAALTECRRWRAAGHAISVAVNLSAGNVGDPSLPQQVMRELRRAQVAASELILEITEGSVIADPDQTLTTLREIAELGVTISLDDFGTGYSSLSYLQRLPATEIKIDRSFVQGLVSADPHPSRALIASITGLGNNLGLRVVAEGIETEAAFQELHRLGCHVAQGYLVARPAPADAFASWLVAHADPPRADADEDHPGTTGTEGPGLRLIAR